jgi:methyl-accepting chemotaxis protein
VPNGALINRAMTQKKKLVAIVDETVFGFPYVGTAMPVFDESGHNVIGGVFIGENIEEQEMIKNMSNAITTNMGDVNEMAQGISEKMTLLNSLQKELTERLSNFDNELKGIESFSKIIEGISKQTNMLGINAAIESARLGEAGRGFVVVAEEIGKLSKRSQESVSSIHKTTQEIQNNSQNLMTEMNKIETISSEINEILSQVANSVDKVNAMVQQLNAMTQIKG